MRDEQLPTDAELVAIWHRRGHDRDTAGYDGLYQRHQRKVQGWIRGMVRGINDADADDISQSAWLSVFRRLDDFVDQASFCAWLYRIVESKVRDYLRKIKARSALIEDLNHRTKAAKIEGGCCRDETERRIAMVKAAFPHLPNAECEVLAMIYYEDCTLQQVAERFGYSVPTAHRRHAAALALLQGLVGVHHS